MPHRILNRKETKIAKKTEIKKASFFYKYTTESNKKLANL